MLYWRHIIAVLAFTAINEFGTTDLLAQLPKDAMTGPSVQERLTRPQNAERELNGLPAMAWDPTLAAAANRYAAELAQSGKWRHSPSQERAGQGENLWMGTRAAFSPEEMIEGWIVEKEKFRSGMFPHVSTSGSWHDVGHYTQIIWLDTERVGCAIQSSKTHDYLVCRYSSPGNIAGRRVGPMSLASR